MDDAYLNNQTNTKGSVPSKSKQYASMSSSYDTELLLDDPCAIEEIYRNEVESFAKGRVTLWHFHSTANILHTRIVIQSSIGKTHVKKRFIPCHNKSKSILSLLLSPSDLEIHNVILLLRYVSVSLWTYLDLLAKPCNMKPTTNKLCVTHFFFVGPLLVYTHIEHV